MRPPRLCTSSARAKIAGITATPTASISSTQSQSATAGGEPVDRWSALCRNTLHLAVLGGHMPTVQLIHKLAPLLSNEQDPWGFTPLALGCARGDAALVKALIGEEAAARTAAQAEGRGRLVHDRWTLGPAPHTLSKTAAGLTPLMLAVRRFAWRGVACGVARGGVWRVRCVAMCPRCCWRVVVVRAAALVGCVVCPVPCLVT